MNIIKCITICIPVYLTVARSPQLLPSVPSCRPESPVVAQSDECPMMMIKCDIQGCEEKRQRQEMPVHKQEYATQHTQLLSQKVRELEEKVQQNEEEAQQRKEQQKARHLPITLTMPNFEQLLAVKGQWMSWLFHTKELDMHSSSWPMLVDTE